MTPELKFYMSPFYEGQLIEFNPQKPNELPRKEFRELVEKIKLRKVQLHQYLEELTRILQIKWERKEIEVWFVNVHHRSFSHPTTISIVDAKGPRDVEEIIDITMHELTHVMLYLHPLFKEALEKLNNDYPDTTVNTRIHILVHAALAKYYQNVRGLHRMEMDRQYLEIYPEYKLSWDIVVKEGPEKILEKYLGIKHE